ncbi:MAG: LLM class flavin-dependent oxidoreductase [Chloroflexi bacterium]|nr:LLM class flavin-dependent oxidoreductase [Chloroflexota bacterium]
MLSAGSVRALPFRERIGLVINTSSAKDAIQAIVYAEQAGVRQVWTTQGPTTEDALTIFAVAAAQTSSIRFGTSILPAYPRHPLAVAAQARTVNDLAPGRLRLGIGTSHRPTIEGTYGIKMTDPLKYLREYISVLRAALWEGEVNHQGRFFRVNASLPGTARVPVLIATLGKSAFQTAGELADGALSWVCPVPYLLQSGLPVLQAGAKQAERAAPPLIAHVPVALETDRQAVLAGARRRLGHYGKLPFYRHMFIESGYPIPEDGTLPDALLDELVISGNEQTVADRLTGLLSNGLDELNVLIVPVKDQEKEWARLANLLGRL